jgi:uncharacterized membrane protein
MSTTDTTPPQARHTVEVDLPRDAAWRYWIHVENWAIDAAIDHVRLDGPFRAGARGETVVRSSSEPVRWTIVEVDEYRQAVVDIPAGGLIARFIWQFEELPGMRTQVTQNVTVHGDTGDAAAVAAELAQTMPTGMARLAAAMKRCVDADVPPRHRGVGR